jgi:hypothetical protein
MKSVIDTLKLVIETQYGGKCTHLHAVKVHRMPDRPGQWDGVVHTYAIAGHATASLCYAWAAPVEGGDSARYFAVLHQSGVTGPLDAVKAAVSAIRSAA